MMMCPRRRRSRRGVRLLLRLDHLTENIVLLRRRRNLRCRGRRQSAPASHEASYSAAAAASAESAHSARKAAAHVVRFGGVDVVEALEHLAVLLL